MGYFGSNSKQHAADLERDRNTHSLAKATNQQTLDDRDAKSSSLETGAHEGVLNEDTGSDSKKNEHIRASGENRRGVDHTIDPDAGLSDAERHARVSCIHFHADTEQRVHALQFMRSAQRLRNSRQ